MTAKIVPVGDVKADEVLNEMDGPLSNAAVDALADQALSLIERLGGNVELARRTWAAAYEEAERLNDNMMSDLEDGLENNLENEEKEKE
jgi:hypothetical protein